MPRPNILLFITDQHRADYLGCSGHAVLRTPHIDSIAARGTLFERFYVATPVCMPNRSTLMTGRMPSVHGVRSNGAPLSSLSNTFADALRAAGYATALVGKSHLQNFGPHPPVLRRPPPRPGEQVLDSSFAEARKPIAGDGPYDQEHPKRWGGRPRFQNAAPVLWLRACRSVHVARRPGRRALLRLAQVAASRRRCAARPQEPAAARLCVPAGLRTPIPEELYPTAYIADKSCEWLGRYAAGDRDKPFFLMTSFPDLHHPFTPPGRYWSMYDPRDMALPPAFGPAIGRSRARWPGRWRRAGAARPTPPAKPPSRSTGAKRARRWRSPAA